jgi:hypothetical protein
LEIDIYDGESQNELSDLMYASGLKDPISPTQGMIKMALAEPTNRYEREARRILIANGDWPECDSNPPLIYGF